MKLRLNAFTLIELLLVVGLIGVLSGVTIAIINPDNIAKNGRDATRKKDLSLISSALEQYYADNNIYPTSANIGALGTLLTGTPKYINVMPIDPKTGYSYCYSSPAGNQTFNLCAKLESGTTQLNGATTCTPTGPGGTGDYCLTNSF